MAAAHKVMNVAHRDDLLALLETINPIRFERLIPDLLGAMEYGSGDLSDGLTRGAGVSSSAKLWEIFLLLTASAPTRTDQILVGVSCAFLALFVLLALLRRPGFAGERLLLIGIASVRFRAS